MTMKIIDVAFRLYSLFKAGKMAYDAWEKTR
jgi:hypothetical protein